MRPDTSCPSLRIWQRVDRRDPCPGEPARADHRPALN